MPSPSDSIGLPDADEAKHLVSHLLDTSDDFRSLFDRYANPSHALRHLGLISWQAGEIGGAIDAFKAALTLSPDDPDVWRDLSGAFDAAGRADRALPCVRRSLECGPEEARSWLLLANLSQRAGQDHDAETGFRQAIALDPTLADAHFGLGLVHFAGRRLDAASASLRNAIQNGYPNPMGVLTLGHLLSLTGQFAACAAAFEEAARFAPLDRAARRKHARARTFLAMIDGSPETAMAAWPDLAGREADDPADVLLDAFSVLSAHGHRDAAAAVGRLRLARNPDDVVQRYLLDAVTGQPLARAPLDYIESHFDGFAATFDQRLVDVLQYDAPRQLAQLVQETGRSFAAILDLGCGTGLAAAHLAPMGARLVGVDLSARMLQQAAARGAYAELIHAEAIGFVTAHPGRFDLVFAADLLIYFGDLAPVFDSLAVSLPAGGMFATSIETSAAGEYTLLPSGRFAHADTYVERVAAPGFLVKARRSTTLRLEAGIPVDGLLLVFERRA